MIKIKPKPKEENLPPKIFNEQAGWIKLKHMEMAEDAHLVGYVGPLYFVFSVWGQSKTDAYRKAYQLLKKEWL